MLIKKNIGSDVNFFNRGLKNTSRILKQVGIAKQAFRLHKDLWYNKCFQRQIYKSKRNK